MQSISYTTEGRIATITLNRPEKRNALDDAVVRELKQAFALAAGDDDVRVIVLAGNGDAFCAGADLAYLQRLQKFSYEENLKDSTGLKDLFLQIYTMEKLVIAQVHGFALAGGCGLASVCDIVVASADARLGYTEVRIGFVPALVAAFLVRRIGEGHTRRLLLGGEMVPAPEAHGMGLVNIIMEKEELQAGVKRLAEEMAQRNSPASVRQTKELVRRVQDLTLTEALDYAAEVNARARSTEDCQRGIAAFLNKEKIIW